MRSICNDFNHIGGELARRLASRALTHMQTGAPVLRAKDEGGAPDTEATGRTLAMSFGRNQSLGKPDLPIHHLHVFPVQLVHKLVERMKNRLAVHRCHSRGR